MLLRLLPVLVLALSLSRAEAMDPASAYLAQVYRDPDSHGQLLYRLLLPEHDDPTASYPFVLFLHGAGERGNDNASQMNHGASAFLTQDMRLHHPCIVMFPQCPNGQQWVDVPWGDPTPHHLPAHPSAAMALVIKAMGDIGRHHHIDPDRVYVMGLSMGGYGVWDILARCPHVFAAAVPMCGGADNTTATLLAGLPIWDFHGGADPTVPTIRSRSMIAALKAAGGHPRYTEYPGVGHDCWDMTLANPEVYAWMFQQKRAASLAHPVR